MFAENIVPIPGASESMAASPKGTRETGSPFRVGVGVVDWDIYGHIRHLHGCGSKSTTDQDFPSD